jgi:ferric iron reductase protein FhuF
MVKGTLQQRLEQEFQLYAENNTDSDPTLFSENSIGSFRFTGADLLRLHSLHDLLQLYGVKLNTESVEAAASLFVKSYAKMLCGALFGMSVLNDYVSLSLANMGLEMNQAGNMRVTYSTSVPASILDHTQTRDQVLRDLFAGNLQPMIQALFENTGIHQEILWENVFIYVQYYYDMWTKEAVSESIRSRITDDHFYITKLAAPELFGEMQGNPLQIMGIAPCTRGTETPSLRIRKTCCLRYVISDGICCKTCPRQNYCERFPE